MSSKERIADVSILTNFSPVAYSIDSGVLHDYPLMSGEQSLQRLHHSPHVRLVSQVVQHPLRIQDIVHRHHVVVLRLHS